MAMTRFVNLGAALVALTLVGCGGGKSKGADKPMGESDMGMMKMKMEMGMAAPSPETQAVLDQIKDYATWPRFAENPTPAFSKGHMKMYVLAFHNDVVADAIASNTLPLPDGALIVKQNMKAADAAPEALTIMSKQGGEWYYAETSPDGKVITMNGMALEGRKVAMCTDCHDTAADNDYVFTHKFPR